MAENEKKMGTSELDCELNETWRLPKLNNNGRRKEPKPFKIRRNANTFICDV